MAERVVDHAGTGWTLRDAGGAGAARNG